MACKFPQLVQVLVENGVDPIHVDLEVAVNKGVAEARQWPKIPRECRGQDPKGAQLVDAA
ncbi:MAG: hypothetical protein ABI895_15010 [Deltaproteobacteria bacterium]